jgi:hypothetical protein
MPLTGSSGNSYARGRKKKEKKKILTHTGNPVQTDVLLD